MYKVIEVDFQTEIRRIKFKIAKPLSELQDGIGDAFYKGAMVIRFYKDYRKKNDYLEVKKENYDKQFCEDSYIKLKKESDIKNLEKRIENFKSGIELNQKYIDKLTLEIEVLRSGGF
jgi:hypothetical protein